MNDEKTGVGRERAIERADRQRLAQIQQIWRLQQEQQGTSLPIAQGMPDDICASAAPSPIRVLLADDHAILRTGLRMILSTHDGIEVIGEAGDGRQAISEAQRLHPDVILMDITMPECNGIEATRQVKRLLPETRVLVLTMHENEEYLFQMLRAGASGYILKEAVDTELITAIRVVATGRFYLSPSAQSMMVGDYLQRVRSGEERDSYSALTEREREILKLVAEGRTNNQIAELLFISPKTVDTHRTHIMDKLNLHSRAELVKYAMRRGLLED